jgi:hypothetical protein
MTTIRPELTGRKIGAATTQATRFLTMGDLMERWQVSRQTLEKWLRHDPLFPPPHRFANSTVRKFKEGDVEVYERAALARREAKG